MFSWIYFLVHLFSIWFPGILVSHSAYLNNTRPPLCCTSFIVHFQYDGRKIKEITQSFVMEKWYSIPLRGFIFWIAHIACNCWNLLKKIRGVEDVHSAVALNYAELKNNVYRSHLKHIPSFFSARDVVTGQVD